jgi:putative peptide zinc metalloprotease protein
MVQNENRIGPPSLIGEEAPDFQLPSIQGQLVSLAGYQRQRHVILWFSRGFTCHFCRGYMEGIIQHYDELVAHDVEVIQVAPNLLETARSFFGQFPPYPFVCDPDKRLYAVYGLGDRGVIEATRNTVVSFASAFASGEGTNNVRGSWLDVMNRNFMRRLHHHALTAVDQGLFIIDKDIIVRYQMIVGALESIPSGRELLALTEKSVGQ